MEAAKLAGAKRAILLPVSAPFHCPLMRPAQERLKADLDETRFSDLRVPLINNWQAREIRSAGEAREGLYQQVPNPVRWAESIERLAAEGVERWFEAGAGLVLTGLLAQPGSRSAMYLIRRLARQFITFRRLDLFLSCSGLRCLSPAGSGLDGHAFTVSQQLITFERHDGTTQTVYFVAQSLDGYLGVFGAFGRHAIS